MISQYFIFFFIILILYGKLFSYNSQDNREISGSNEKRGNRR